MQKFIKNYYVNNLSRISLIEIFQAGGTKIAKKSSKN